MKRNIITYFSLFSSFLVFFSLFLSFSYCLPYFHFHRTSSFPTPYPLLQISLKKSCFKNSYILFHLFFSVSLFSNTYLKVTEVRFFKNYCYRVQSSSFTKFQSSLKSSIPPHPRNLLEYFQTPSTTPFTNPTTIAHPSLHPNCLDQANKSGCQANPSSTTSSCLNQFELFRVTWRTLLLSNIEGNRVRGKKIERERAGRVTEATACRDFPACIILRYQSGVTKAATSAWYRRQGDEYHCAA